MPAVLSHDAYYGHGCAIRLGAEIQTEALPDPETAEEATRVKGWVAQN